VTPDRVLVDCAKRGDEHAFAQLVTPYQHALFGLAIGLTGNRADAEEVLQDVLADVLQGDL
jgi:DNA-directed RNA polymerase specialized sigma24 family protein